MTATFNPVTGIDSINHVIILVQENRSLDNYLGALRQYWAQNGFADESFDGLPQFNPAYRHCSAEGSGAVAARMRSSRSCA